MSYIIKDGSPIAKTSVRVRTRSGWVSCAYQRTTDHVLVNKFSAKISNARKWDTWEMRNCTHLPIAEITARGELYIPQA